MRWFWLWLLIATSVPVRAEEPAVLLRDRTVFGAYAPGLPYFNAGLRKLEGPAVLGQRVAIASGFIDWDYILGEKRDLALATAGRTLLYSWEPHCVAGGPCISFRDVADGKLDGYLNDVAESMKRFPYVIYVRPWAELNAHWSPYRPGSNKVQAGSVEDFKRAWRHLVDFFRARQVHNLRFVFNPDASVEEANVPIASIWPGQQYVDVLGIDGYNWGESKLPHGNTWQEFEVVFADMYSVLTALHPTAPVWICEFGSKEPRKSDGTKKSPAPRDPAHSKARWIEGFMRSTAFPRIEALVYYSAYTAGRDNQRDFRFESSTESLQAIRRQLKARARAGAPNRPASAARDAPD